MIAWFIPCQCFGRKLIRCFFFWVSHMQCDECMITCIFAATYLTTKGWFPRQNLHNKLRFTTPFSKTCYHSFFERNTPRHVQATSHDPGNELIQRHLKAQISQRKQNQKEQPSCKAMKRYNYNGKFYLHSSPSVNVAFHRHLRFSYQNELLCFMWLEIHNSHAPLYIQKSRKKRNLRSNLCSIVNKNLAFQKCECN